jgi:hypothetical protein
MGKWMNRILVPAGDNEDSDHIAPEDMARLVDAAVDNTERVRLFQHINRCRRCYDILQHSIEGNPFDGAKRPVASVWWKRRTIYALAASILLVFIISGQLVYRHWTRDTGIVAATLDLDQQLIDILLEDSAQQFGQSPRLSRLLSALGQRGVPVDGIQLAVLSKPYYQKKDIFGPPEYLHIRIEDNVAYLEVKEAK